MGVLDEEEKFGEDEEGWIVSYADMMSLLLCFFIMLYTTTVADEDKLAFVSAKLREAFKGIDTTVVPEVQTDVIPEQQQARAFQLLVRMLDLGDVDERVIGNIERKYKAVATSEAAKERMLKDMGEEAAGVVSFLKSPGSTEQPTVDLILPADTLFSTGSAALTPDAVTRIRKVGAEIIATPAIAGILVSGHTDSRPMGAGGEFPDNWGLSAARAAAVARVLIEAGVKPALLETAGKADGTPLAREFDADGKPLPDQMAKNRRVEIRLRIAGDRP